MTQSTTYTFGTSRTAADRLERVARFFNRHSRVFVERCAPRKIRTAVDLGCGPGFTTAMLRETLGDVRVVGLDNSREFLGRAASRCPNGEFLDHDVSQTPLPVTGELLFARFLLSHLVEPCRLIGRWLDGLAAGGMLLVEELEDITTTVPVFRRYLELNEVLVASTGGRLYVGRELASGRYDGTTVLSTTKRIPVRNADAASWFHPNSVGAWSESDVIRNATSRAERAEISAELAAIGKSKDRRKDIVWTMRQIALRRD